MKFSSLSIILLLLSYLSNAQPSDNSSPATTNEITIAIGNDSIAVMGMLAAGKENKETIILLHGLPGNERNLDIAQALRRDGKNVIYFNYRGAWGSQGEFLYSNCLEDVTKVIDFFSLSANAEKYRIKPNSFVLLGHSMGGGIALLKGAIDDRVKKIAIYSPLNIGTSSPGTLDWLYGYTKDLFMLNVDPDKFYEELKNNQDLYNVLNYKEALSKKNLIVIDENDRNKNWIKHLDNAEYILMKTDHSFSDKRHELTKKVIEWINK